MRCPGKKFLVSSNYLIGKVTLNFPVTFPALCCTLIPNTCANKQEEMREAPFFLPVPPVLLKAWKPTKSSE